ncbi:hypothetical protein GF324_08885 [bacterium]|nr:hypothetical protein [bacterium]
MASLEEILTELEEWLQTHKAADRITPATWEELPEELQDRLSNFARDAAVQRADDFAREGLIDLNIHEGIRDLVNAMALVWTLKGARVRAIVEDYIDELPAPPGREFIKLADQLFRHRSSGRWQDLVAAVKFDHLTEIVRNALEEMNFGGKEIFDRALLLEQIGLAYSRWALRHPKEAVDEVLSVIELEAEEDGEVALDEILALMRMRGAEPILRAIELEEEVGLEALSRADMVRMLKRYALIVKREGGLKTGSRTHPRLELVDSESTDADNAVDKSAPANVDTPSVETPEPASKTKQEPLTHEETEQQESTEPRLVDTTVEEVADEIKKPEPELASDAATPEPTAETEKKEESPFSSTALSAEDEEAISSLFGGADLSEDDSAGPDGPAEAEAPEAVEADAEKNGEEPEQAETEAPSYTEGETRIGEKKVQAEPEDSAESETHPTEESFQSPGWLHEDAESGSTDEETMPTIEEETESEVEQEGEEDDPFSDLRSGELHDRIVKQLYEGDETLLEVFLAKLKGAPDWSRAKQMIANELFRCKVDLHSEIGEEFFLTLKRCMGAS